MITDSGISITAEDLARLPAEEFDALWQMLGRLISA